MQKIMDLNGAVFSTYVEVILKIISRLIMTKCVLHVCGGDPATANDGKTCKGCSPRMWR